MSTNDEEVLEEFPQVVEAFEVVAEQFREVRKHAPGLFYSEGGLEGLYRRIEEALDRYYRNQPGKEGRE